MLKKIAALTCRWLWLRSGSQRPDNGLRWTRWVSSMPSLPLCQGNIAPRNPASRAAVKDEKGAFGEAAKAIAKRLRPTDSIYHLADDLFGIVLPETDTLNAKRIALRLQEGLQDVRAKYGLTFDLSAYNYPDNVKSSHELEDIVESLLPEEKEWQVSAEVPVS